MLLTLSKIFRQDSAKKSAFEKKIKNIFPATLKRTTHFDKVYDKNCVANSFNIFSAEFSQTVGILQVQKNSAIVQKCLCAEVDFFKYIQLISMSPY